MQDGLCTSALTPPTWAGDGPRLFSQAGFLNQTCSGAMELPTSSARIS